MSIPNELHYTNSHEWVLIDGETGTIGITDFAQSELGDVVFIDLPEVGDTIEAGEPFGEIESTKAVSDLKSPLSGEVIEINEDDDYSIINSDPYKKGWMLKIKISDVSEVSNLLDSKAYSALID
jgi:glycine cleavage system H protein